jgi:hypothetical protein
LNYQQLHIPSILSWQEACVEIIPAQFVPKILLYIFRICALDNVLQSRDKTTNAHL